MSIRVSAHAAKRCGNPVPVIFAALGTLCVGPSPEAQCTRNKVQKKEKAGNRGILIIFLTNPLIRTIGSIETFFIIQAHVSKINITYIALIKIG